MCQKTVEQAMEEIKARAVKLSLGAVMPLWVSVYHMRGGPSDDDFSWAEEIIEVTKSSSVPVDLWLDKEMFKLLAKSAAVLSFRYDGVVVFGEMFNARQIMESLRARSSDGRATGS